MIYVEDAETGERSSSTPTTPRSGSGCAAAADERQAALVADLRSAGLDLHTVATDDDLVRALFRLRTCAGAGARRGDVTFAWPWVLLALAAVPLLVLWYRRRVRRPGRPARRAGRARPGRARPPARRCKRSVPPALLLSAVVLLLVALARPEVGVRCPRREGTVILAFDVSSSMTATDLTPDPDGRREGRGAHRRRAPAADRAGRRRRVRQQRPGHPAADRGPGERARRDRPPPAGRRHGAGQRPADLAQRDHRADGAGRRAGSAAQRGRAAGPGPRLPRLRGRRAVLRRGEHRGAGPGRRRRAGVERGRAGLPGRDRVTRGAP